MIVEFEGPVFYSSGDEGAMFAWLEQSPGVAHVTGRGTQVVVSIVSISNETRVELKAIAMRYGLKLEGLPQDAEWTRRASAQRPWV